MKNIVYKTKGDVIEIVVNDSLELSSHEYYETHLKESFDKNGLVVLEYDKDHLGDCLNFKYDSEKQKIVYNEEYIRDRELKILSSESKRKLKEGYTTSLGHKLNSTTDSISNLRSVLSTTKRKKETSVKLRLYDNSFADISVEDLEKIIEELEDNSISILNEKWDREEEIRISKVEDLLKVSNNEII